MPRTAFATEAFLALYANWRPIVHAQALRKLACREDAEDATQNVFTRLWARGPEAWRSIDRPASYFMEAGRREALAILRARDRERRRLERVALSEGPSHDDGLDAALDEPLDATLAHWLDLLPPRCREALVLTAVEGMERREAAARMRVSVKAVEKQLARARRLLRADPLLAGGGRGPAASI